MLYTCDAYACPQQAQIVKTDLAAIGLRVDIHTLPPATMYAREVRPGAAFDLAYTGWVPDYLDPSTSWRRPDTGWHQHPGPSLIFVVAGTMTNYDRDDPACAPHSVQHRNPAFVDAGGTDVHMPRNESEPAGRDDRRAVPARRRGPQTNATRTRQLPRLTG